MVCGKYPYRKLRHIDYVESYQTAQFGTVWQRVYRVCRVLSHRTLWQILVEFIWCVKNYQTSKFGTLLKVYGVCA
jgi:hypothetical protein